MKYLYIVILTLISLTVNASQCDNLNESQVKVLNKAYHMGKAHNLSYTMMAIAMEESGAGAWRISFLTKDYGVMQNNIKTAANRTGTKGYYNKLNLAARLVHDDNLSMELALEELLYWKQHTPNWRGMVSAYNNGWAWDKGTSYLNKIIKHVKTFMNCWEELPPMLEAKNEQRIIDFHGLVLVLPEEVNYVAMDSSGEVWGYEDEPIKGRDAYFSLQPDITGDIHIVTAKNPKDINWANSLVRVDR